MQSWPTYLSMKSRLYRVKLPYFLKYKLGFTNQERKIMCNVPGFSLTENDAVDSLRFNDIEEVKRMIFRGLHKIDDPVCLNNLQTMLHYAVTLQREEIFDFLLK